MRVWRWWGLEEVAKIKIYGILGYPAKHSLSPLMHNVAFRALKINAEYKIFEKKPQDLEDFFQSLCKQNIYGLNVTVPYKEKVMAFLDEISSEAKLIGAANTIKVSGKKLIGYNTDGEGFLRHLSEDLGFRPQDKSIAIIGAGGAARAISVYMSKLKPKLITIYDIDKTKALTLVKHLKENFHNTKFIQAHSIEGLNIKDSDLLINATAIGMQANEPCLVDEKLLHSELLVYDLIYNLKETKLLALAKKIGARVSNGLGMLLYQGALSFEIWTGKKAPKELMQKALIAAL